MKAASPKEAAQIRREDLALVELMAVLELIMEDLARSVDKVARDFAFEIG